MNSSVDVIHLSKQWKSWFFAIRPKTLTASFIPICVATLLAFATTGHVYLSLSLSALMASFCIQIGTNLINDALDFKKGEKIKHRLGPIRITQLGLDAGLFSYQVILRIAFGFFFLAIFFTAPLIIHSGISIIFILIASLGFGYTYSGGPYPLSYHGFGELFVILFFGLVSVSGLYFIQTGFISAMALVAGLQVGFLAALIIAIDNLRDIREDKKTNKRTLAVRFGQFFMKCQITLFIFAPFLLNLYWIKTGFMLTAILPWTALPLGLKILQSVWKTDPGPIYNQFLSLSALFHFLFGLLLTLGLALQ